MTGSWKARKSKSGFPALSTVPWKSRKSGAIPTFPPTTAATYICSPLRGRKPKTADKVNYVPSLKVSTMCRAATNNDISGIEGRERVSYIRREF